MFHCFHRYSFTFSHAHAPTRVRPLRDVHALLTARDRGQLGRPGCRPSRFRGSRGLHHGLGLEVARLPRRSIDHAVHQRSHAWPGCRYAQSRREKPRARVKVLFIRRVGSGPDRAGIHPRGYLRVQPNPRAIVDWVAFSQPAGAECSRRFTHRHGVDPADKAGARRTHIV